MLAGENQPRGRSCVPSLLQDSGWQTGRAWVTLGPSWLQICSRPMCGVGEGGA